jgi:hypothetical protein
MVLARYRAGGDSGTERANETMLARYGITLDDVVARLTHPETGVTAHTRRFSHLDAIRAVAHALPNGIPDAEVGQLTDLRAIGSCGWVGTARWPSSRVGSWGYPTRAWVSSRCGGGV